MLIPYNKIKELGFKHTLMADPVYEEKHGFPWVIIEKKLSKKVYLAYEKETSKCYICRLKKGDGGWIADKKEIESILELETLCRFFCKKNYQ